MKMFISYAREDEAYREELGKHLSGLRRQNLITEWHDRKLVAGQHWGREISAHLQSASVILLLVSPDFMASDYCWDVEMVHAFAMEKRGDAVVIPVIIRPVDFQDAPFSHLQALPTDAKPVSRWSDHDEAWVDVVRGIRQAITRFRAADSAAKPSPAAPPALSYGSFAPDAIVRPLRQPRQRQPGAATTSRYGDVAVLATQLYTSGDHSSPRAAWDAAAGQLLKTPSVRDKGCPRATFLSLCQEGWIPGIPAGEYTSSQENREHAVAAVRWLADDPELANRKPESLWRLILQGAKKQHNHQMDVVQALWRNGLIEAGDQPAPEKASDAESKLDWLGDEGDQLRKAFIQVFGDAHRAFGSRSRRVGGLSDGNEGVQWNVGYNPDTLQAWVGVNLEGMQYHGWPVARLIQRELLTPTLPNVIRQHQNPDSVVVRWRRDYWQAASRPPIEEKDIAPTPIAASELTEDLWRKALEEAAGCLDATRAGGGRATQEVTLSVSKQRVTGPVSPHLTILFPSAAPYDWELYFSRAKAQLQPFYDWAVQRAV